MTLSGSRKSSCSQLLSRSKTDRATPSLQPHYSAFFTTTGCSVPVPRFGTQILVALPLISLPFHRGDRFPRSTKEPRSHSRRLYAGRHLGSNQVPPRLFPGFSIHPGFDVFCNYLALPLFFLKNRNIETPCQGVISNKEFNWPGLCIVKQGISRKNIYFK